MDWTLERINGPKNFIVLDKNEPTYTCGRNPCNKVICPSLVVSRRHCIFVRANDVISVIDLRSSNGCFVNGRLIKPSVLVELQENDIIGIGCSEEYRDDEPMFLFKLHKGNLESRNLEEFDDLLTQRAQASPKVVEIPETTDFAIPVTSHVFLSRKRNLREIVKDKETPVIPQKVPRLNNGLDNITVSEEDVDVDKIEPSGPAKVFPDPKQALEADEIEEIWSTFSPQTKSKQKANGIEQNGAAGVSDVFTTAGIDLNRLNRLTLDIENGDEGGREALEKVELVNCKTEPPISPNINLPNGKEAVSRKDAVTLSEEEKTKEVEISVGRTEPIAQKPVTVISGVENSHKTTRFSSKESSSATRFTIDILDSSGEERIRERGDREDSPRREKGGEKSMEVPNEVEFLLGSPPTGSKGETNESQSDEVSSPSKKPVATSSPFKLKLIKQEPMTSFSIFDTVDISDDDDDMFPSSQLFDSTTEGGSFKVENDFLPTKAEDEDIFENEDDMDVKNFFNEVDPIIQESDKIITLSDSDDEENPWLHRLSESQRIKGEEPEIAAQQSPEMEFVDELLQLKADPIDGTEPEELGVPRVEEEPKIPDSLVEAIAKSPKSPKSPKFPKSPNSMTLAEIERDLNDDKNDESDSSPIRKGGKKSRDKSLDDSIRSKQGTPKGPKIIEPLRLPQRKRLSSKDSFPPIDRDNVALPSTSKARSRIRDCSVEIPKLPLNLTAKQKRELQIQDRIKQKQYEDEQRIRRSKNKWAQSVPLPIGRRKSSPLSKKQKLKIVNERKEKLKALALTKQKSESVKPSVERVAAKAKAKVSTKNRGDFLINEQLAEASKLTDATAKPSTSKKPKEAKSLKSKHEKDSKSTSKSTVSKKPSSSEAKKELREEKHESKTSKEKRRSEKRPESVERSSDNPATTSAEIKLTESLKKMSFNQKENRVPNSMEKKKGAEESGGGENEEKKTKKKVTFSENLVTVREYEIDPNNTMKKCTGKDALIPKDKMAQARRVDKTVQHPKLEEFLMQIFMWNPSWLEEQKHLRTEPPIVANDVLVPLLTNYKSYRDYYQVLMPLLLLELWHGITKEFESIDKNNRRQTVYCSVVNNSVTFQPIPSTNTTLTTMLLEVLASEEDMKRQLHPVYGDLVFLELCYRDEDGKQNFLKVFAYVTQLHKTTITPNTFFNRDLMNYTPKPSGVLTYTVLTRPLTVQLCINRVLRLRCVTYLRANMRMVQALQSLPTSPLLDSIINPKVEQYQLSHPPKQQSFLVTRDKLNHRQMEAVFKTTATIVRKEPKICLIQGPPGTGKSEVIVNMVMQTLYGDNRYKHKETSLRILLCAPSNAAVDEIVLRLLDRRAKLNSDRFKMVRVGLLGPMHPKVRDVSVEELAKREVKRTISSYQSCGESMSSVEEEKRFLEARINALQCEMNSSQKRDENQIQHTRMKLAEMRMRYDMINTLTQSKGNNISPKEISKLQRASETKILIGADIIACTLSSCYTNIMESTFGGTQKNISVCIVDEATQSCEAETLIPLMLGVNTLVLVGDPAQLPATVISQKAKKLGLDQSLFSRVQRAFEGQKNSPVIMLDVQYRMDVHISYWPNKYFYAGKLKNGMIREQPLLPFNPYRVINLDSFQNSDKFSNTQEAEFVANVIYCMINHLESKQILQSISIGVITPYRNQQVLVKAKIDQRLSPIMENLKVKVNTEINTVDSFQGHECDIIIMSCVRSNGIGFLSDPQRLCVALTRARHCLVLCGNFGTFQRDTMWRGLITDAQSRKNYIEMKSDSKPNEIVSQLVR